MDANDKTRALRAWVRANCKFAGPIDFLDKHTQPGTFVGDLLGREFAPGMPRNREERERQKGNYVRLDGQHQWVPERSDFGAIKVPMVQLGDAAHFDNWVMQNYGLREFSSYLNTGIVQSDNQTRINYICENYKQAFPDKIQITYKVRR